ncbi:MAG: elongation factor G [Desulfuromonadales bacterium]|nr:elongation factor G [Desulfuromonadales bacterium]
MGTVDIAKLRNVGFVGQGDSGKTSLAEALLFAAGKTDRLGKVDEGNSNFDYEDEEIKRKITITSSLHHCDWKGFDLTIIDTPGYTNFLHDTRSCMRALDGAVLVVSAVDGVKAQSSMIWKWASEFQVPRIAFINKMDRERADFRKVVAELEKSLDTRAAVLSMPIGSEANFRGIIDLVRMKARIFTFDGKGGFEEADIPAEMQEEAKEMRFKMVEVVAEANDALMEKYLEEDNLTSAELFDGLHQGTVSGIFTPVICGSAAANAGTHLLLDTIMNCLPAPTERPPMLGIDPKTGAEVDRKPSKDEPFSAFVFKTISDPYTGRLTLFKIVSGELTGDSFYNSTREVSEKFGTILRMEGKKQSPVRSASAGEIVAVAKLKETVTGDTLCAAGKPIVYPAPEPLHPVISFALEPKNKGDEDKIHTALKRLMEEDPCLQVVRDEETKEMVLSGMGQIHVEVVVEKMKRKFGVDVLIREPKVPYREAIRKKVQQHYRHKKQSGGRGQFADIHIEVEPLPRGSGYEFVDKVVGGSVPRTYIPAVDKGVQEAMRKGIIAGFPVQDVRVTLYDGQHHAVDSSEMAFKIAGAMGFKKAMEEAKPALLEPIVKMEINVPDECVGDVIGDMNSRRGKVLGMDPNGGSQIINAQVPMSEVLKYAPELRSMTSDRGMFTLEFSHYEEIPGPMAQKIITELQAQ